MNAMRKVLVVALVAMLSSCACALELPATVGEWRCVNEHVVPLVAEADGSELGRVVYRDYVREAPAGSLQVILTEGTGTGSLYVPEQRRGAKGVMPADAGYKIVDIGGRKGILEQPPHLPAVLAVSFSESTVITIEASALDEEGIAEFAVNIITVLP
ncbi:MAG: hypothetical protein IJT02_05685 [Synergistaceae bacterium]|nr:hypothetical protein [Synergistaceae bacterium]